MLGCLHAARRPPCTAGEFDIWAQMWWGRGVFNRLGPKWRIDPSVSDTPEIPEGWSRKVVAIPLVVG